MNIPRAILIHCTDYSYQKMFDQFTACDGWHKDRGFTLSSLGYYIGYHRLITGDKNYQARLDTDVGCHCNQGIDANGNAIQSPVPGTSMNFQSLGICVGFDGDIELVTPTQYNLLQNQIWQWQDQYKITNDKVYFHRHFALDKTCPGSLITAQWLKDILTRPLPPPEVPKINACIAQEQEIADLKNKLGLFQKLVDAIKLLLSKF